MANDFNTMYRLCQHYRPLCVKGMGCDTLHRELAKVDIGTETIDGEEVPKRLMPFEVAAIVNYCFYVEQTYKVGDGFRTNTISSYMNLMKASDGKARL